MIVLDLDDTLYLERDYVRSGFRAVDQWLKDKLSLEGFFSEAWSLFERGERRVIFNKVLEGRGIFDTNLIKELVEIYRSHLPFITLEPDAEEFLRSYRYEGLAMITDGPAISQWSKIKALNIQKYVETIIVTEDLGPGFSKPDPAAFKKVQGSLSGSDCVYIADNPLKDFVAPNELGWKPSIRIRRIGSLHFGVPTPDDCMEVCSLSDLRKYRE